MKVAALSLGLVALASAAVVERAQVQGFDISHYQPNVDFKAAYKAGARFVLIKVRGHPNLYWRDDDYSIARPWSFRTAVHEADRTDKAWNV